MKCNEQALKELKEMFSLTFWVSGHISTSHQSIHIFSTFYKSDIVLGAWGMQISPPLSSQMASKEEIPSTVQ